MSLTLGFALVTKSFAVCTCLQRMAFAANENCGHAVGSLPLNILTMIYELQVVWIHTPSLTTQVVSF